ncbi:hypothetical protein V6R21_11480 [Limibacter armeniacum]|uniref:hypothetical protein n=1 Tax=Limibacter armeniacum TaxID=466084 RepID=UPI002FE544C0
MIKYTYTGFEDEEIYYYTNYNYQYNEYGYPEEVSIIYDNGNIASYKVSYSSCEEVVVE